MQLLTEVDQLPAGLRFVLSVGVYDGVHRGHLAMLRTAVAAARRLRAEPVVLTFDPHPEEVLRGRMPPLLCDPRERIARLAVAGIAMTVVQHFDLTFADQAADAFLRRLASGRELVGLVMTEETAFGRDRAGTLPAVEALAPDLGFEVVQCTQLLVGGERVSSGRIRRALDESSLGDVRRLMGRPYAVVGKVVRGDGRGRELGFPTANLAFDRPVALPRNGIYAVRVEAEGRSLLGVASLGVRPTFGGGERLVEVYLFDFSGNLYGQRLRIEFIRRQRGERKFGSVGALVRQMERDASRARKILAALPGVT